MTITSGPFDEPSPEYDSELAERIKSILRNDDSIQLPEKLSTDVEIQLISNEIMQGGLGRVGRYWDEDLRREVAVKFIQNGLESQHGQRFLREIMIASSLDHPGVVPIYNSGERQGKPYYTMRYVSGQTFAEAVREFHQSPDCRLDRENSRFRMLLESLKSACATIGYAHRAKQVWHRDVKPQNIMIENGLTVVLDWGLAKHASEGDSKLVSESKSIEGNLTKADQYLGSPAYMAPEQAFGDPEKIDQLTDIYGLGATLFELLTGRAPHLDPNSTTEFEPTFQEPFSQTTAPTTNGTDQTVSQQITKPKSDSTLRNLLKRIASGPTPEPRSINPAVPAELNSICKRAMAFDKMERYPTAEKIIEDIENWLVQAEVGAHKYNRREKSYRWLKKHTGIVAVVSCALILIAAISTGSFFAVSAAKKVKERALSNLQAERQARMIDQLDVFVAARPVQAEVILQELQFYPESEILELIENWKKNGINEKELNRIRLIHLQQNPEKLLPLVEFLESELAQSQQPGSSQPVVNSGQVNSLGRQQKFTVGEIGLLVSALENRTAFRDPDTLDELWKQARGNQSHLVTAAVLAKIDSESEQWTRLAPAVVSDLMEADDEQLNLWADLFFEVRNRLKPALMKRYEFMDANRPNHRTTARKLLTRLYFDDMDTLVWIVMKSDESILNRLLPTFMQTPEQSCAAVTRLLAPDSRELGMFPGDAATQKLILDSSGAMTDRFVICDQIKNDQFELLQNQLQETGFRLVRYQPLNDTNGDIAAIWISDGRPGRIHRHLSVAKAASLVRELRNDGWIPSDLSLGDSESDHPFALVFYQDFTNPNDYQVMLDNSLEQHRIQSRRLGSEGFQQLSYLEYLDNQTELRIAGLYCRNGIDSQKRAMAALFESIHDPEIERLAEMKPIDMRGGPRGVSGIWNDDLSKSCVIVLETDPKLKIEKWLALAKEGYVPSGLFQSANLQPDQTGCYSIWTRPLASPKELANLNLLMCQLGYGESVLKWLERSEDQTVRTELIHRFFRQAIRPSLLLKWLETTDKPGVRSALIQALGEYPFQMFTPEDAGKGIQLVQSLLNSDPDPGVHSASLWTLQNWGQTASLSKLSFELDASRDWFQGSNEHTMAVIRGPQTVKIGSRIRPQLIGTVETFHLRTIPRSFAISIHETTWNQFKAFSEKMPVGFTRIYSRRPDGRLNQDAPQYQVNWYRAAEYCNWLSEQEGLPPGEWCYVPNDQGKYGPGMSVAENFLERKGYRLPTEAEWEFAARAGTETPQFFGRHHYMLRHYAWYRENSGIRVHTAGSLKPNELGLFDVYGNVWEWCHGSRDEPWPKFGESVLDRPSGLPIIEKHPRILRGGALVSPAGLARSAVRSFNRPSNEQFTIGFRVARTIESHSSE